MPARLGRDKDAAEKIIFKSRRLVIEAHTHMFLCVCVCCCRCAADLPAPSRNARRQFTAPRYVLVIYVVVGRQLLLFFHASYLCTDIIH